MTREEELDWLCRLRSEIYVYMPKEWLIPMNNALDMAIKALEQEPNCSEIPTGSITKNCRTCRNFGSHHGICEICKDNKCWTEKEPIERYHSRNLKAYADDMGVSVEQAEKELLTEEPFINKPCVSSEVCEHDKNKVLDKLRAEIDGLPCYFAIHIDKEKVLAIIDKYRAEIESQESEE